MSPSTPTRCTAPELGKVGVELSDYIQVELRCCACGEVWAPERRRGQLVKYYWRCPNGCNHDGVGNQR